MSIIDKIRAMNDVDGSERPYVEHSEFELASLGSIDMNLLVPLLALLEERSVTRAAERVALSQPAMSHVLRRLRLVLGDQLLVREGNVMVLTPQAEGMHELVLSAVERAAAVLDPRPFNSADDRRVVTIALTTSAALSYGPRLIRTMKRHAPNVVLRFQTTGGQSTGVFSDRGVDAVLLPEGYESAYPRERLYEDRWVVVSAKKHASGFDASTLIEEEPHIAFVAEGGRLMRPYSVLDEQGVRYEIATRVTDYLLVPHLLASTGGVALHRLQATLDLQDALGLQYEEFPFAAPGLNMDVVWNPLRGTEAFRGWLREMLFQAAEPLRDRLYSLDE